MSGTHQGGKKTALTNKKIHGNNYYAEIGCKGGQVQGTLKGFAADPERARIAGKKGGSISRRGKIEKERTTND